MARHDQLLPNALIVARREYRDRTRSTLFIASTLVLMALALGVTLAPIGIRYLDQNSVTRIAVVAADARLETSAAAVTDGVLNSRPANADPETWEPPFLILPAEDVLEIAKQAPAK